MEGKERSTNWVIQQILNKLKTVSSSQKFTKENNMVECLALEQIQIEPQRQKISRDNWIWWDRPMIGSLKLNIDGAAKGNPGESGGGGVMRDAKAKVIFAFAFFYGTSTNMVAEARALLDGLRLCKAFGFKNFVVESDSKVLMDFISKKGSHPWSISFFWPEIIDLMDFLGPHHQHQFREGNQVADALANEACKSRSHQIFHGWSEMPRIARGAARCDTNGFPNIRPSK
ncbi:uncharacterized protein LOC143852487 [Tasmannia lanceolata]|uniref:uncharacterized protein LOC143852487 n=1 Tax=Tasmannia lanceolata TaxID=3420 RepID=UPI0040633C7C